MKKILILITAISGVAFSAGPSWGQWGVVGSGAVASKITSPGSYYTTYNEKLENYVVNARGSSAADTMTAYIADANGKIGTDLCTWIGTAAGYVQAGGADAHLDFKGAWQLIVTKCVGSFTVTVDQ